MTTEGNHPTAGWSRIALRLAVWLAVGGHAAGQSATSGGDPPPPPPAQASSPSDGSARDKPPAATNDASKANNPSRSRSSAPGPDNATATPGGRDAKSPAPSDAAKHGAAPDSRTEERLRRMEEAYLRLEQNNQRIQSQYDALLKKYDTLTRKLNDTRAPGEPVAAGPRTLTVNRSGASVPITGRPAGATGRNLADVVDGNDDGDDPPVVGLLPLPPDQEGPAGGAEGTGGRTGIRQQQQNLPTAPIPPETVGAGATTAPRPFQSRMDQIGAGAEGTGGRTYPTQQPAAARGVERGGGEAAEAGGAPSGVDLKVPRHPGKIAFGEGLEFTSDDGEFRLQFHNLTQAEFRGFDRNDLGVLEDQFFIPRQRWYFVGELTRNVSFYTVINRGYGSLDLLDAFVRLRINEGLRIRFGRMKTPYLYEYFSIADGDLVAPERSIYASNFALNREIGFMFLGEVLGTRLSYAAGVFNGPRRSFQNLNNAVDLIGTATFRPFLKSEQLTALKYFNIGGSWDVGYQNNNPPEPIFFETANDQTPNAASSLSPTFLHLNSNTIELGERVQWGAHAVWFYKSFFALAEYGGARAGYGVVNNPNSTPVDFSGYNVTMSYFLTGEQVTRRVNMVQPRRDFNFDFLKPGGKFSPGAVEVFARYSTMAIGKNIFTAGFADPNLWTNHVYATDLGINWYLNFYTRVYLDWQHDGFGNEVSIAPGKFSSTADIYWVRLQVFF